MYILPSFHQPTSNIQTCCSLLCNNKIKYIKNNSRILQSIVADHQRTVFEQSKGTCYAHALAQGIISTELRIIGRPIEDHQSIVKHLVSKYGSKGSSFERIVPIQCAKRGFRYAYINQRQAEQAVRQRRVVLTTISLTQKGWDQFERQAELHPDGVVEDLEYGNSSHAVAIVGIEIRSDGKYWKIKNSWGKQFGKQGYFRVKMYAYDLMFLDIYFDVEDLPLDERLCFQHFKNMNPWQQAQQQFFRRKYLVFYKSYK